MRLSNELQIGKAGEYLVCADLIRKGFIAYPSEQGLSYDVVLDTGNKLIKIQVKTTLEPRNIPQRNKETKCYIYNVKRKGKGNKKRYEDVEVDIFALVALDSMEIGYLKNKDLKTTMNFRVSSLKGTYYDEKGMSDFRLVRALKEKKMSHKEISKELNLNLTTVYRMLKDDYKPYSSEALYLSDIKRDFEWFDKI